MTNPLCAAAVHYRWAPRPKILKTTQMIWKIYLKKKKKFNNKGSLWTGATISEDGSATVKTSTYRGD